MKHISTDTEMKELNSIINVRAIGAKGDGIADDYPAFCKALAQENCKIIIPEGKYIINGTLRIKSGTSIIADKNTYIIHAAHALKRRGDFLLTNDDIVNGNENISISGGIWDGSGGENERGELFDPEATSGSMLNFINISNLTLSDMTWKNPLCYYSRFGRAKKVHIENIRLASDVILSNQDAVHLSGFCSDFTIRSISGTFGSPNDDFIALNADDSIIRQENRDLLCGPIENITVDGIFSERCHSFVRLLSVTSKISNISVKNISGGCSAYFLNMDAARYCRVPIFKDSDEIAANGVGDVENIFLENISVKRVKSLNTPLFDLETNCRSLQIRNFTLLDGEKSEAPTFLFRKMAPHEITLAAENSNSVFENGKTVLKKNETLAFSPISFHELSMYKV